MVYCHVDVPWIYRRDHTTRTFSPSPEHLAQKHEARDNKDLYSIIRPIVPPRPDPLSPHRLQNPKSDPTFAAVTAAVAAFVILNLHEKTSCSFWTPTTSTSTDQNRLHKQIKKKKKLVT